MQLLYGAIGASFTGQDEDGIRISITNEELCALWQVDRCTMKISEKLRDAREYEEKAEQEYADIPRPAFHLTPRTGWMNDPNGFSFYKGQYHLFYQYHPYDAHWGPMHWGHAVSQDLLHWTYLPAALAPDTQADRDGCFSGSASQLPDGRQLLIYTGVRNETQPDGTSIAVQSQCIATGDGLNYEKYEGNPVLTTASVPGGSWDVPLPSDMTDYQKLCTREWPMLQVDAKALAESRRIISPEFRDPKLLDPESDSPVRVSMKRDGTECSGMENDSPEHNGTGSSDTVSGVPEKGSGECIRQKGSRWRCVAVGGDTAHDGSILAFGSEDGLHWHYERTLLKNWGRFGRMWECPDLFRLDGKAVLLVSPLDMPSKGYEYRGGNETICLLGTIAEDGTFREEQDQAVDYGLDFYASQTLLAPDGRRIMVGWLQSWETSTQHPVETPWFGQMSIPRELSLQYEKAETEAYPTGTGNEDMQDTVLRRRARLIQKPIRELETLRKNGIQYRNVMVDGERMLDGVSGRTVDMGIDLDAADAAASFETFSIRFAERDSFHTSVTFRPAKSLVTVSRAESGSRRGFVHERSCLVRSRGSRLTMRILLDRFSVEIFINGGEQVLSTAMYTDPSAEGISFFSDGRVRMTVSKWDLVP